MDTKEAESPKKASSNGRLKLIRAALKLAARNRSLSSLGLRELAREAGLNHTAFYRHFSAIEDLAVAIVDEITRDLRQGLRQARLNAAGRTGDVIARSTQYYFEFVEKNPDAFTVAVREIHGAMPALRQAVRQVIADMAVDMEEDMRAINMFPGLTDNHDKIMTETTNMIVYQLFYMSLDYLEAPEKRQEIVDSAVRFIQLLTDGALAQKGIGAPNRS